MAKRTVNADLLREAIENMGNSGLAGLAVASSVSVSWLEKALTGNYESAPRAITRAAICRATKLKEDDLFPVVAAKGKNRAS
jgi:hypothetical protein